MIWLNGALDVTDHLTIPLADPFLAHGLGLFETFRTWQGKAPLLGRHRARLRASAQALGIDLTHAHLPDAAAVTALTTAHSRPDAVLRLTVTAGHPPEIKPTAWLTCAPLPPPAPSAGYRVSSLIPATVFILDPLARHKTTNYWERRLLHERATTSGSDEAMIRSPDGRIWEGSRTSLFLVQGQTVLTPHRGGPLVPGVMRSLVLERAGEAGFAVEERDIWADEVDHADEVFLTNSVRGLIPVGQWVDHAYRPRDPSFPATTRLRDHLIDPLTGPKP